MAWSDDHLKVLEKTRKAVLQGGLFALAMPRGAGKTTSGEPLGVHNAFTFVLVKQGERWRVKHVHESSL